MEGHHSIGHAVQESWDGLEDSVGLAARARRDIQLLVSFLDHQVYWMTYLTEALQQALRERSGPAS